MVPKGNKKWRLFRASASSHPFSLKAKETSEWVRKCVELMKSTTPLHEQLLSLEVVKRYQPPEVSNRMFQTVRQRIKLASGLTIPQRITIRIPLLRGADSKQLGRLITINNASLG